jgi:hypothetical protein
LGQTELDTRDAHRAAHHDAERYATPAPKTLVQGKNLLRTGQKRLGILAKFTDGRGEGQTEGVTIEAGKIQPPRGY